MSLRYGHAVPPRPVARLCAWFERRSSIWTTRRYLQLEGPILTYRKHPQQSPDWVVDLRESVVSAGSAPSEIIIHIPGKTVSVFALSHEALKTWFSEMKRVSDSVYDFYHFPALLSHSSSATVHLGLDRRTSQSVAIVAERKKDLPLHKTLVLTKRDFSVIAATQTHPALVTIIDLFESSRAFYIVTELVSCGPLSSKSLPLHADICKGIIRDVLLALVHLHDRDIVHGDVKPQHVILTKRQLPCRVKLNTFGIAVSKRDARLLGDAGDSCAPEVVCFERRTPMSDVFAAGVMLYEMLKGKKPFGSGHESEYLSRVSRGVETNDLEDDVGDVLKNMLADDASARFSARQCLQLKWLRDGISERELVDVADDPKTVIVGPSARFDRKGSWPSDYGKDI